MRGVILGLFVVGLLGGLLGAQPHAHGWFVTGQGHLHYLAPGGKLTSVVWPGGNAEYAMMHWDNRTVLVPDFSKSAIVHVDPVNLAVVGTFMTNAFGQLGNFQAAAMDSNGDIFFGQSSPQRGVFKIDHATFAISTIQLATSTFLQWPNQFSTDVDTGEIIVGDDDNSNPDDLYLVHRDGSRVTKIGTMGGIYGFTMGCFKHIPTGDIYSGEYWGTLNVLKAGTKTATLVQNYAGQFGRVMAPCPDRASAARQSLVTAAPYKVGSYDGIWRIDVATSVATKLASVPRDLHRCIPAYGRNIQSVATTKGKWDVHVSFPGHAGKPFLLALSASGPRNGVPLPDGRTIPLLVDQVTVASVTTGIPGIVNGNLGRTLDGNAEALVRINLLPLGSVVNGLRVWLCALVLDSQAPIGIAEIADTKCLVVEGL